MHIHFLNALKSAKIYIVFLTIIIFATSINGSMLDLEYDEMLENRNSQLMNKEFNPAPNGLYVNSEGIIMKSGKPYKGHGVNYYSLFSGYLSWNEPYRDNLRILKEHSIPFVRFNAGGYWPSDFRLYFDDKEFYYIFLDNIVKTAESLEIGLIPSLFWYNAAVPDMMDEPRSAWGDVNSKTHEFMRQYTMEIVTRYKDSPAIWGWEFGNEYNLEVDIPNPQSHRPPVQTDLGTRDKRDERDDMTTEMMIVAYNSFAEEVRKHDPYRVIITGNGGIRPTAWNLEQNRRWSQDTEYQHKTMIIKSNPFPYDLVSIHLYHNVFGVDSKPDTPLNIFGRKYTIEHYVNWICELSKEMKAPLFIGEWGAPEFDNPEDTRSLFMEKLNAIEKADVPLSAMWVYSLNSQNDTWNVTAYNSRSYMLKELQKLNLRILAEDVEPSSTLPMESSDYSKPDENSDEYEQPDRNKDKTFKVILGIVFSIVSIGITIIILRKNSKKLNIKGEV